MDVNRPARFAQLTLTAILFGASPVGAQAAQRFSPGPPVGTLTEDFAFITSVRELSDGRVLISDEKENRIVVADFTGNRVTRIGRIGDGPTEYRRVGRLWALGGDSTLMVDPLTQRRIILHRDRIVAVRPRAGGPVESGLIYGADHAGNVLTIVHSMRRGKLTGLRDSMFVIRGRAGGRIDTIARVPSEYANLDVTKPPATVLRSGMTRRVYRVSLSAQDQAVMFRDGAVAVARTNPYRVDWCLAGLRCAFGDPIAEPAVRASEADRKAFLASMVRSSGWPDTLAPSAATGWPDVFPAFAPKVGQIDASSLIAMSDGRLLIERVPSAASPSRYDIIDRRGQRAGQLSLRADQRVAGFGVSFIYIIVTDDDGLQRLEKHRWP